MNNKLKRKALDDSCERLCKIVYKELCEGDISTLTTTVTVRIGKKYLSSELLNKMVQVNLTFTPCLMYANFKYAMHSAISEIFSEVIRKDCCFHLG